MRILLLFIAGASILNCASEATDPSLASARIVGEAQPKRPSVDTSTDSLATRQATVSFGSFCASDTSSLFEYALLVTDSTTGDLSGYAVRIRLLDKSYVLVEGSEAIGSLGKLSPVSVATVDAKDPTLLQLQLARPHPDLEGPTLTLNFDCDSAWGVARAPYKNAPNEAVNLPRRPSHR